MEGINRFLNKEVMQTLQKGYTNIELGQDNYTYKKDDVEYVFNGDTVKFTADVNSDGKLDTVISDRASLAETGRFAESTHKVKGQNNVIFDLNNGLIMAKNSNIEVIGQFNTLKALDGTKATVISTGEKAIVSASGTNTEITMRDYTTDKNGQTKEVYKAVMEGLSEKGSLVMQEAYHPDTALKGIVFEKSKLNQHGSWAIGMANGFKAQLRQEGSEKQKTKYLSAVAGPDSRLFQMGSGGKLDALILGNAKFFQLNPEGKEKVQLCPEKNTLLEENPKGKATQEEVNCYAAQLDFASVYENFENCKNMYK